MKEFLHMCDMMSNTFNKIAYYVVDHTYTGTADGKILHIYKGEKSVLTKLGKNPCGKGLV
jgi:hypothetical protein